MLKKRQQHGPKRFSLYQRILCYLQHFSYRVSYTRSHGNRIYKGRGKHTGHYLLPNYTVTFWLMVPSDIVNGDSHLFSGSGRKSKCACSDMNRGHWLSREVARCGVRSSKGVARKRKLAVIWLLFPGLAVSRGKNYTTLIDTCIIWYELVWKLSCRAVVMWEAVGRPSYRANFCSCVWICLKLQRIEAIRFTNAVHGFD